MTNCPLLIKLLFCYGFRVLGVILGFLGTLVAQVGFITPVVVGHLTFQNQTVGQWQKVFWIAGAFLFTTGTLFCIFAKSELQPWNSPEEKNELPELQLMITKNKDNKLNKNEDSSEKAAVSLYSTKENK